MTQRHVIITMAGHSRRFHDAGYSGPKALLQVGDRPMIEHVVDMFDPRADVYHIIVNDDQVHETPDLEEKLSQLASRVFVTVVPSHEEGPVFSALQAEGIGEDDEVIVSYCDFVVQWNYRQFLRHVHGLPGGIVSFRGFHPASFGDTYYAYMRVDNHVNMLELREKQSFTEDRTNEHASAGIYYFSHWSIFRKYAERLLKAEKTILPEAYVSLLYNDMVSDGLQVLVHEAQRFVCLGTPEDFEQYQFWHAYFHSALSPALAKQPSDSHRRVGLIPMAGRGSRFREFGYRVAKPLILVEGVPMVTRAISSMPNQDHWVFLPRREDVERHPIDRTLREIAPKVDVVVVDEMTSGQAATCLLAEDVLFDDDELTIGSCDYEQRYDVERWQRIRDDPSIDGAVWTFRTGAMPMKDPSAFAYCELDDDGVSIKRIVEKDTISDSPGHDPLVIGTFWYRCAGDFKRGAMHLIERDIKVNGEHYVGTSINHLLEIGRRFVIFDVEQWISFGDPFELTIMEYWSEFFKDY